MDQLRVALTWLKEQHFWVLTVIASITAVICWYLAAAALADQFKSNQGKINTEFNAMRGVGGKPFHPNDVVNQQQAAEIEALATRVSEVWGRRYQRQRDEVLQWPAQLDAPNTESSTSFIHHVSDKQFGDFISDRFRDRYLNYIQKRFPDLPKIIKAQELSADGGQAGVGELGVGGLSLADYRPANNRGAGSEIVEEEDYLVRWQDQGAIKQQLAWSRRPSALKIWVTQEDLWVYETLLRAIAATNEAAKADRYSNAAVRDIYQLQVGREAAKSLRTESRIYRPAGEASPNALSAEMGMESEMPMEMDLEATGEMDFSGTDGPESQLLLAGRYIDADEKPLPAPRDGEEIDFGLEFKRLPVKLNLNMDQRWLPRLLVELANAPLQVEAKEVRINPAGGMGASGGSGGGRSRQLRALQLASRTGNSAGGFSNGSDGVAAFDPEPQVGSVIVRGVVYIFNPPDESALAVDNDGGFDDDSF